MSKNIGCISTLNILTVVFVVCKLLKIINWSWIVCFLPTIISSGICVILFILFLVAELIGTD